MHLETGASGGADVMSLRLRDAQSIEIAPYRVARRFFAGVPVMAMVARSTSHPRSPHRAGDGNRTRTFSLED